MAQITLSGSNSKIVATISENEGFINRVASLCYEHALNLIDAGTPTANEQKWSDAVLGGPLKGDFAADANIREISRMIAVQADTSDPNLADTATDAQIRTNFDLIITRAIDAWVVRNP